MYSFSFSFSLSHTHKYIHIHMSRANLHLLIVPIYLKILSVVCNIVLWTWCHSSSGTWSASACLFKNNRELFAAWQIRRVVFITKLLPELSRAGVQARVHTNIYFCIPHCHGTCVPSSIQQPCLHNTFLKKQENSFISISQIEAKARLFSLPGLTKWPRAKQGAGSDLPRAKPVALTWGHLVAWA